MKISSRVKFEKIVIKNLPLTHSNKMKLQIFSVFFIIFLAQTTHSAPLQTDDGEQLVHFGFQTENGQYRSEDIMYNNTNTEVNAKKGMDKPVEYRGGYSFISADGYEYMVFYKANKNGFQPYVTARKIKDDKSTFAEKNSRYSKNLRTEHVNKNERKIEEDQNKEQPKQVKSEEKVEQIQKEQSSNEEDAKKPENIEVKVEKENNVKADQDKKDEQLIKPEEGTDVNVEVVKEEAKGKEDVKEVKKEAETGQVKEDVKEANH